MGSGSSKSKEGLILETIPQHTEGINCLVLSEDSSLLVTGSDDCDVAMWSTLTNETECLGILKGHTAYITCVAIAEVFVLSGSADKTIRKWDMTTCECLYCYEGHTSRVSRVICTGDFLFSTSYDHTAKAWLFDVDEVYEIDEEKVCIRTFEGHTKGIYPMIFIPSTHLGSSDTKNINPSDILLTGSADNTTRSWSFDTGGCLKVFQGHRGAITCMTTDPLGQTLYTGSSDCDIRSWDISKGTCLKVMEGHDGPVINISVVDRLLYSGSQDCTARCWVREFGDCTRIYKGHKHSVTSIRFREGTLFTGCGDTCARSFDAKSGQLKCIYQGHEGAITAITVVEDKLFTVSTDATLRVWKASPNDNEIVDLNDDDEDAIDEVKLEKKQQKDLGDLSRRLSGYYSDTNN